MSGNKINNSFLEKIMAEEQIPGLALAVIKGGNTELFTAGLRDIEQAKPLNEETVFTVASLSKPVFSYAVIKLFEKGDLDIDIPLTKYLNELGIDDFKPLVQQNKNFNLITARNILSQTSGLPNWTSWITQNWEINKLKPERKITYSGPAYFILGEIISKLKGDDLNDIIRKEVFEPLQMNSSSFKWESEFLSNHAIPYSEGMTAYEVNYERKCDVSGSLHSTVSDYAKFVKNILKGYSKTDAAAKMFVPQNAFKSININIYSDAWTLGMPMIKNKYGVKYWHWGEDNGFQTYFEVYPKEQIGFVYLTNSDNGLYLANTLASKIYGRDIRQSSKASKKVFGWLSSIATPSGPIFDMIKYI